jgi:acid stress chaperone HdeB
VYFPSPLPLGLICQSEHPTKFEFVINLKTAKALVVHSNFVLSGLILVLALSSVSTVQAQVTVDASKITCDQFVHSKVAPTRTVAAWLSGFYSGKRDNRVIDLQNFEANLSKLENFCYEEKNYKLPVMQAIEKVIGRGK